MCFHVRRLRFFGQIWGKTWSKLEWLMLKRADANGVAPETLEGTRGAAGSASSAAEVKRWSTGRKRGVMLRLLRGEPVDAVSREVGVTIAKLEQWRELALSGMEAGLKTRYQRSVGSPAQ
jgi:transposase